MSTAPVQVPSFIAFNQDDDTVDPDSMQQWLDGQDPSLVQEYIQAEGGHFYHGQLTALKRQAQAWLEARL